MHVQVFLLISVQIVYIYCGTFDIGSLFTQHAANIDASLGTVAKWTESAPGAIEGMKNKIPLPLLRNLELRESKLEAKDSKFENGHKIVQFTDSVMEAAIRSGMSPWTVPARA